MKIAITADLHLRSRKENPERYAALENIFTQANKLQINTIIVAGDLFDAQYNNYSEFESVCRSVENRNINVLIIPGNHDHNISQTGFTAENVHIFSQPQLFPINSEGLSFLFVPYQFRKNMGEVIAGYTDQLKSDQWILVGHGDWMGNSSLSNQYEKGYYMPLSHRDINTYRPRRVFLGHIHAPVNDNVIYPGSPCGMDNTETGRRRFIVYDLEANEVKSVFVDTQYIFFNRTFTIFPIENERVAVQEMLQTWIESWNLTQEEEQKVRVRVKLRGFALDKNGLYKSVLETLNRFKLEQEPDLDEISITNDLRRSQILRQVKEEIGSLADALTHFY